MNPGEKYFIMKKVAIQESVIFYPINKKSFNHRVTRSCTEYTRSKENSDTL
jgi:hypothetical protein